MFWADKIVKNLSSNEIINDSKTPSGRVHIGSLRGVVIHYVIYKILKAQNKFPKFLYGIDDYDPMDEIPANLDSTWKKYMGKPLCKISSPDQNFTGNFSDYYINEFIEVINKIGIKPEIYKMSDLYRLGKMNESIEIILNQKELIRDIYLSVSGSKKPFSWYPFQVICENCGKIGTTLVHNFHNQKVEYSCEESIVKWAKGCSYKGKVSPFNGFGKLPWKLEWVAKWKALSISVEGAGKDHSSHGGSRDIAAQIYQKIFKQKSPYNIPYEFFLVSKKKMSSSKGIGSSSKEIVDSIPSELLLFLMIRYAPNSVIDFNPKGDTIPKLYDEYDRCAKLYFSQNKEEDLLTRAFELSQTDEQLLRKRWFFRFSTIATLIQIPKINIEKKAEESKTNKLSENDLIELNNRKIYARKWLDFFANDVYKFEIIENISEKLKKSLNNEQKNFIKEFLITFIKNNYIADEVHQLIYEITKKINIKPKEAFKIIYQLFIGKNQGPKVGTFLVALDKFFIKKRLEEILSE